MSKGTKFKVGDRVQVSVLKLHDPYLLDSNLLKVGDKGFVTEIVGPDSDRSGIRVKMDDKHHWSLCADGLELEEQVTSVICDHDTLRATCKTCNASTPKKAKTSVIGMDWSQDPDDLDDVDELRDLVRSCQERIDTLEEENDTGEWYDDTNEADFEISEAISILKSAKEKLQKHL